jgi:Ser/Thr protein kinase RdoA (MazF antagonist)
MNEIEVPLTGGRMTQGVVRAGNTVRRPLKPNASFVHALLLHLESAGFTAAPRFLGIDSQGREVLSFIAGNVPADLGEWTDVQLIAAAKLIRAFHDATLNFGGKGDAEVVCHGDLSPCNTVFVDGVPSAFIDFDAARPGRREDDLGYAAWLWLDAGNDEQSAQQVGRRLALFGAAYGVDDLRAMVEHVKAAQRALLAGLAPAGERGAYAQDVAAWAESSLRWTEINEAELIDAINRAHGM